MTDNEYQIYWREQFQAAQREIAEMAMTQAVLVAALKRVEWVSTAGCDHAMMQCPWCDEMDWPNQEHRPDCPRQLALERCNRVADKKEDAEIASPSVSLSSR